MKPSKTSPFKNVKTERQLQRVRPFVPTSLAQLRPSFPPLPSPAQSQNKFTVLGELPKLPGPKPESSSGSTSKVQNKSSYEMKTPESFAQAVDPKVQIQNPSSQPIETFEFLTIKVSPILALDKEFESGRVQDLVKPCYNSSNYVDSSAPLHTRLYFEAILVDTDSIEIEHVYSDRNPDFILYSQFTIRKILSPFEWHVDHLLTPIRLSMNHKPQTYNWYTYQQAWYNFMYLRPGHTWFIKYSPEVIKAIIPRWFYDWWKTFGGKLENLPQQFLKKFENFQTTQEITTLPSHIKMCKYYIQKRISFIISWDFKVAEFDRIRYLSKEIKVKGWVPKRHQHQIRERLSWGRHLHSPSHPKQKSRRSSRRLFKILTTRMKKLLCSFSKKLRRLLSQVTMICVIPKV